MVLFISPPFGNYLSLPNTISIKGSYTLDSRPGLIEQIFKTLRYSFIYGGWINKIGLRNPGIDYAVKNHKKNTIISIAILEEKEVPKMLKIIPEDMNIEINISCPNVDKPLNTMGIEKFINSKREWCILKLQPIIKLPEIDKFYKVGFWQFHCSNTYPIKDRGGLSGVFLIPHTTYLISQIKKKYPDTTIIAGGGVRNMETADLYKRNGADHISISTLCFNPILFANFYRQSRGKV